jgi:hypothetical protein
VQTYIAARDTKREKYQERLARLFSVVIFPFWALYLSCNVTLIVLLSYRYPCGGGVEYLHRDPASRKRRRNGTKKGCVIAQAVSRWLPTAAVRGSRPGVSCGILWWTKWRWGRFCPSTSVSPANFYSTNCSKNHPHLSSGFVQ